MSHKNPSAILHEDLIFLIMEYAKANFPMKLVKEKGNIKHRKQKKSMEFDRVSNTMGDRDDGDWVVSQGGTNSVVAISSSPPTLGGKKKRKAPSKKDLPKKSLEKV